MPLGPTISDTGSSLLPTLAKRDYRFPNAKPYAERGGGKKGQQLPEHCGGPLDPTWALYHMGYGPAWDASAPQGTRSIRSSGRKS
jgi:hypothetical protein